MKEGPYLSQRTFRNGILDLFHRKLLRLDHTVQAEQNCQHIEDRKNAIG